MQSEIDLHIAELEAENAVIPEFRKRVAELETEIPELRKKVVKVEARLVILEQRPLQNDNTPPNKNTSNFNLVTDHHGKSLEDKEADDFLNEIHKKRIGDDIRRHNKEKKLQRESADQEILLMYQRLLTMLRSHMSQRLIKLPIVLPQNHLME